MGTHPIFESDFDCLTEMEELIALCETAQVTPTTWASKDRLGQFKEKKARSGDQRQRRKECLERIKREREALLDKRRNLDDKTDDEEEEKEETGVMDVSGNRRQRRQKKVFDEFANALMQSEWLVDVPTELDKWTLKVVPYGRRRLLDAQFGATTLYDKRGRQTNRYWSSLPGGGKKCNLGQTLLDGIFDDITKTFYVLDVLAWAGYDYTNCESDFRFYWLEQKMTEKDITGSINIVHLPAWNMARMGDYLACSVRDFIDTKTDVFIDGLLFYHNEVHYQPGVTPLVGWLKPAMIEEQFNIIAHQSYLNEITNDKRHQHQVPDKLLSPSKMT